MNDPERNTPCKCPLCGGCPEGCAYSPLASKYGSCCLIEAMASEISQLEAEVVRTRQILAEYLPKEWADGLRQDIFSGLSARFYGLYAAYDSFVDHCHAGIDPMESDEQVALMLRLRDGTDKTTYYHLLPPKNDGIA